MKMCIKKWFFVLMLLAVLAGQLKAQTFTTLYRFTAIDPSSGANIEGAFPLASLVLSGNTLYGTAAGGGDLDHGTVFKLNTDGTGIARLHSFTGATYGDGPQGGLVLEGGVLYGTTAYGGGTLFAVNTDGTGFRILHNFGITPSDGWSPTAGLTLAGNTLYGTTSAGGTNGTGTIFAINTDGLGYAILHNFTGGMDGGSPFDAGLVLSSHSLYGMTEYGGSSDNGIVYAIHIDGTGFTTLYSFTATTPYTNADGAHPQGSLLLSGKRLYGMASHGGSTGFGTVFAVNSDGTGFKTLYSFTGGTDQGSPLYNPVLYGNTLYGTTSFAPRSPWGGSASVFKVNTDGTGFATVYSFTPIASSTNSDGESPTGLLLSGSTLYGTTTAGGPGGAGTVFSISLPVSQAELTIIPSGANVIVTWPTNATGLNLQSTTNLVSPVWTTNSPATVIVNGQNKVTNAISGTRQFFRLSQ